MRWVYIYIALTCAVNVQCKLSLLRSSFVSVGGRLTFYWLLICLLSAAGLACWGDVAPERSHPSPVSLASTLLGDRQYGDLKASRMELRNYEHTAQWF